MLFGLANGAAKRAFKISGGAIEAALPPHDQVLGRLPDRPDTADMQVAAKGQQQFSRRIKDAFFTENLDARSKGRRSRPIEFPCETSHCIRKCNTETLSVVQVQMANGQPENGAGG
jgi:hypothetical protein